MYEEVDVNAVIRRAQVYGVKPECLDLSQEDLEYWGDGICSSGCQSYILGSCPIQIEPDVRSLVLYYVERHERETEERNLQRSKRIDALITLLVRGRLPVHWQLLADQALANYPQLFQSEDSIRGFLFSNQDVFDIENGVVQIPDR